MNYTKYAFALLVLLLSGCSSLQSPQQTEQPHNTQAIANAWTHWQASGKASIKVDGDNTSANLNWLQNSEYYQVRLSGPFGQGGADISGDAALIRIEVAGEEPIYSTRPAALMREHFGWELPLGSLHWWLKGVPTPQTPFTSIQQDTNNRHSPSQFKQHGWIVEYTQFHQTPPFFPRKIRLRRDNISALLVIKSWQQLETKE